MNHRLPRVWRYKRGPRSCRFGRHVWVVKYDHRQCVKCGRVDERVFNERGESF